jgi:hypothetical protein
MLKLEVGICVMSLESVGLVCILIGIVSLPYAILYYHARNNHEQNRPPETVPFEPFSIFSLKPIWRKCMRCHTYAYATDTLCHAHAIPAPLVPLSYKTRYRVQRMSATCIYTGEIAESEQEEFERFALSLMAAHPEIYWAPDEAAALYHLDECAGSDSQDGGFHAVL